MDIDTIDNIIYYGVCTILILYLLMISPLIHAKVYPLMLERNWYADEVVFYKANYTYGVTGTLKTKWGTLLADEVVWYLTEELLADPPACLFNRHACLNNSRISYIDIDYEWIELKPVSTTNYTLKDGQSYASRIASYINTRQLSEVCRAKSNQLWFTYPEARSSAFSLIWNLHSQYPYVHVVNQNYGFSFEKP